jgi:hypothetical protein
MGPEEKKPEDQRVEGQAPTTPQGAPAEREGEAVTATGDTLSGRTGAVEGEVPAGLGRVTEPEPAVEPAAASAPPPKPGPKPVEPEPVRPAAAEPVRPAASPWRESEPAGRERATAMPPPPPPAPERKGGGGRGFLGGLLGSLLMLALAGTALFFTRDQWVPRLAATVAPAPDAAGEADTGGALAALKAEADALKGEVANLKSQVGAGDERLSGVEARIDELAQKVGQPVAAAGEAAQPAAVAAPAAPDLSQPVAELDERLGRMESDLQRLDRLEAEMQRLAGIEQGLVGVQSAVSEVRSEVQTAVDRAEQQASQPAATVLAVNQLADALGRSGGYARQLEAVRVIAGDSANLKEPLDRLEAWAGAGLSTLAQLQGEFPAVAQRVAQSEVQSGGEGWLDDVTNRLTSLVTVRKVGDAALASGGTDAALVQAEAALKAGDLAGAVQAVEGLQGQAAEAASPWLAKARDRVAAEKALADLRLAAIAQLDAARG